MSVTEKRLIVLGGPTASGKTDLAIALANYFHTEIISYDARQFYAEMSIGTAKPTAEELQKATHHFIGHKSIKENYTAGDFEKEADALTASLFQRYDTLIAVGGSGLYLDAWLQGLNQFPEVIAEVRYRLNRIFEDEGLQALQKLLKEKDPTYYTIVDKYNHRRLIRALEVCLSSDKPYSAYLDKPQKQHAFVVYMLGIDVPRKELYGRINRRVDTMIDTGLEDEARNLYPYRHFKALHTIGYSEWVPYFEKKLTRDAVISLIKQHTRNYAKRQMTWFRRYENLKWLKNNTLSEAMKWLPA